MGNDLTDGIEAAAEGMSIVASLAKTIVAIVEADNDKSELEALQTAAESIKFRMDQLKFGA